MSRLLYLKGLPASGKTDYAKKLVAQGYKRVNKDDLRAMIDDGRWSRENEAQVVALHDIIVNNFLELGFNVVVDNTGFAWETHYKIIADNHKADFEVKFFDVPVMECIERDSKRGEKSVGAKVIMGMYEKYLRPKAPVWSEDKLNCYVFDIDGTLAKMDGRSPYDYSKVDTDLPNHNITMIARTLRNNGLPIVIVSGRTDDCREATMQWLAKNNIPYDDIHMRKSGDARKDSIIKKEIYENELKDRYNILAVFDDRNQVVDMWRSLGLTVLQVDYGNF